ncbi:sodium/hydrogen exchanger 2-like isoform X3 [Camellia sinensis]|uniref:sodium/hydrogen exchanger 2-like isoform X3 n=1 Tax=Camellia sinensis TaxID=4442 RepID=UPI00103631D2|nr:sodium/hydrogen exchanger 2-like isoform X3 [Camellia sinensis]XP_028069579.1 sodium/hydrogen exchanger 2-like isoform X3 [Camellia sinensis]
MLEVVTGLLSAFIIKKLYFGRHAFATLSFVCEIFIFLYVGMDVLDMEKWRFVNRRYGSYVKALSSMRVLQACANLKAWELSARF